MNPELHITSLRVTGKQAAPRVAVAIDDGRTIELDPEIVVGRRLKSGEPIAEETIDALQREDEALRARRRLTSYLALRVKSVADARVYLERAGFTEQAIRAAVEDATARDLLDDRRFAESFVRTHLKTGGPQGPLRLLAELVAHGIDGELAESVLQPQFDPEWQRETAEAAARKWLDKAGARQADAKKLFDHLQRRGFTRDIARDVAHRLLRGRGVGGESLEMD